MPAEQRTLVVVMNGHRLGELSSKAPGRVELTYNDDLVDDPSAVALSVSMPLVGRRYRGRVVDSWISGLLPERSEVLRRWRREFGVRRRDAFSLLWHLGEDVAGAAQFVRPDRVEAASEPGELLPLSAADVGERLRRLHTDRTAWGPSPATGQFSLAGAQAKLALHLNVDGWSQPSGRTPTTHIIKPAIPDLPDQDLCEHLTMRTATGLDLAVPATSITMFADERALVVQRFDRARTSDGWLRVHQEDMCQALGVRPDDKYEVDGGPGVARIATLIRETATPPTGVSDVLEFLRAIGFNWLVAGTDAHAKNYAFLHGPGQSRLAPLYDLNSFLPYRRGREVALAMMIGSWQRDPGRVTVADWVSVARKAHVEAEELLDDLRSMAERLPDVARDVTNAPDVATLGSPFASAFVDTVAAHASECLARLNDLPDSRR